ncbi:ketopantoate reductase family protein [Thalassotalea fusca]
MKTLIVGQGAIGLLWYSHFKISKQQDVQLLASPSFYAHSDQQDNHTIDFTNVQNEHSQLALALATPEFIKQSHIVLVCVKAFQLKATITALAPNLSEHAIVLLCHNGMVADSVINQTFDKRQRVISMLLTHGSKKEDTLAITHTGLGKTDIGLLQGELTSAERQKLVSYMSSALPPVYWHDDISTMRWQKLAINCVINPICAINNSQNKIVLEQVHQEKVDAILQEIVTIAALHQISLDVDELKKSVLNVAKLTGENICSTLADIRAGKRSEIAYLNGFVHAEGQRFNVATPMNTTMWQQVTQLSQS